MIININDEAYNEEMIIADRPMATSSSALGIMRHQLVKNIGLERIKGFLVRFGWEMGVNDAKEALKKNISVKTLIEQGPIVHMENGHIRGFTHQCSAEFNEHDQIVSLHGSGTWIDSYEAVEHVKRLGLSHTQVCHTLIGYSSGFMTTICGQTVLAKETTCVGKGDSVCTWITRTKKEWDSMMEEELSFYQETPIMEELEYTYEQLLEQQSFLTQLTEFQKKLNEEIANGTDLETITNMVFNTTNIPIVIEDKELRTITYAGLTENMYHELDWDMKEYLRKSKSQLLLPIGKKTIKTERQEKLISPIFVEKKVLGYCSFLYNDGKNHHEEKDYLLLDRFANAVSLILLNEKTRFESFERMKGNFLEQILQAQVPPHEIIQRGKYANLDLDKPYYVVAMEFRKTQNATLSIEEEFYLQEQVLEAIFEYFSDHKYQSLIGQREGKLVLLMIKQQKTFSIHKAMLELYQFLEQAFPNEDFKLGISNEGYDIKEAAAYYEEASIALKLTLQKSIVSFDSLGIVGILINSNNLKGIKMVAKKELGSLYQLEDSRNIELLKTLFVFLSNGGKLEQTMSDLALSMSGLRHRIRRMEELLEKDLRDPEEMHQLLLILKALIAIGEFSLD
ncbi:XylR N-terminal domain-containing protein [Niallia endozanthoxylica]|uniref:PucR family transcriptional regulator n=1 Tax=Niallia endozanthoxylica TaxID=2036016 RepID=A0A5J5HNS4_9BACI|nr:XylR N-terminal domain-containing protein [Niallia endozanthoxylica]KAA9021032.1 PucR family transcriptional regulator [Niallia endozanthoxylica]